MTQGSFPSPQSFLGLVDYTSPPKSSSEIISAFPSSMYSFNQYPGLTLSPGSQDSQLILSQTSDPCLNVGDLNCPTSSVEERDHSDANNLMRSATGKSASGNPLKPGSNSNYSEPAIPSANRCNETTKRTRSQAFPGEPVDIAKRKDRGSKSSHKVGYALSLPLSQSPVGFQGNVHAANPQSEHCEDDFGSVCSIDSLFDEITDISGNSPFSCHKSDPNVAEEYQFEKNPQTGHERFRIIQQNVISEATRQRFNLSPNDLAANAARELFQKPTQNIEYTSPYAPLWGTLGYVPSAVNLHMARSLDIKQNKDTQSLHLPDRLQKAIPQRDTSLEASDASSLDRLTEESNEKLLREEIVRLRHLCAVRQRHASDSRKEAGYWRTQWYEIAKLYEFHQMKASPAVRMNHCPPSRVPNNNPLRSATPNGNGVHLPQNMNSSFRLPQTPMPSPSFHQNSFFSIQSPVPLGEVNHRLVPQIQAPKVAQTIDLTVDDEDDVKADEATPAPTAPEQNYREIFRRKDYNWLGDRNHMKQGFDAPDLPKPPPSVGEELSSAAVSQVASCIDGSGSQEDHEVMSEYSEGSLAELLERELAEGL